MRNFISTEFLWAAALSETVKLLTKSMLALYTVTVVVFGPAAGGEAPRSAATNHTHAPKLHERAVAAPEVAAHHLESEAPRNPRQFIGSRRRTAETWRISGAIAKWKQTLLQDAGSNDEFQMLRSTDFNLVGLRSVLVRR
jgi:hypothetical protein